MIQQRICRQCGAVFLGGPRAWYCPDCRAERKKQQAVEYLRRKRAGRVRKIGIHKSTCEICGDKYTVTGGLQRYCPDCAPAAVAEIDRKQGMDYYTANKNTINPVRNDRRRKINTCVICGKQFPAAGKCATVCGEDCRRIRQKRWQQAADAKRSPRKR